VTWQFNGLAETPDNGKTYVGLIADEVEPVMPEMVGSVSRKLNSDDAREIEIKTLDATALTFALVNAVKEIDARSNALETSGAV
jgi:hypothetical protein